MFTPSSKPKHKVDHLTPKFVEEKSHAKLKKSHQTTPIQASTNAVPTTTTPASRTKLYSSLTQINEDAPTSMDIADF